MLTIGAYMRISPLNSYNKYSAIHFDANKVSEHKIKKINDDVSISDFQADFIKFDLNSENDKQLFDDIYESSKSVPFGEDYSRFIASNFITCADNKISTMHYYALVKPQSEYDKVNENNILGLIQTLDVENDEFLHINWLQSMPEAKYNNPDRKYKEVGKSILDCIVDGTDKDIELTPTDDAEQFYLDYGFVKVQMRDSEHLIFHNNKKLKASN